MNQRLRQLDSEAVKLSDVSRAISLVLSLPSNHIHYATYFRYAIPEIVEEKWSFIWIATWSLHRIYRLISI